MMDNFDQQFDQAQQSTLASMANVDQALKRFSAMLSGASEYQSASGEDIMPALLARLQTIAENRTVGNEKLEKLDYLDKLDALDNLKPFAEGQASVLGIFN